MFRLSRRKELRKDLTKETTKKTNKLQKYKLLKPLK